MSASAAWRPIGTVLVEAGAITPEELDAALLEQKRSGRKLGEILIESGRITWLTLAHAIAEQASDADAAVPGPAAAPDPAPVVEAAPEPIAPAVAVSPPVSPPAPAPAAPPVSPPAPVAASEMPRLQAVEPPTTVAPPTSFGVPPVSGDSSEPTSEIAERLQTVEGMLKERQRAFLELVSVTERLRATVGRLQDELAARDAEILRLRSGSSAAAV